MVGWTHLPLVPHIYVNGLGQYCFRKWLVTCSTASYYQNQSWRIVNWILRNKLQWNSNQNTKLFFQENAFENVVCEIAAILSRGDELNLLLYGSPRAVLLSADNDIWYILWPQVHYYKCTLRGITHIIKICQTQRAISFLWKYRWCFHCI